MLPIKQVQWGDRYSVQDFFTVKIIWKSWAEEVRRATVQGIHLWHECMKLELDASLELQRGTQPSEQRRENNGVSESRLTIRGAKKMR